MQRQTTNSKKKTANLKLEFEMFLSIIADLFTIKHPTRYQKENSLTQRSRCDGIENTQSCSLRYLCGSASLRESFCFLLFALCFLLQACGGAPETFYYTVAPLSLNAMKAEANSSDGDRTVVLGVEKFSAEALYDDDRIIYRESPYEVKYYHYRRWAAAPRQLVTDEIIRQLQTAGIFRNVVSFPNSKHVDYVLTGRIASFEEWDRGEHWFGRVAFTAQLYDSASRQLLWSEVFEAETQAEKRIPTAVVEAIGKSLEKCITDLQQALPERVKK